MWLHSTLPSKKLLTILALLLSTEAWTEPPPTSSNQGSVLHGTGYLETANIPLLSGRSQEQRPWSRFHLKLRSLKTLKPLDLEPQRTVKGEDEEWCQQPGNENVPRFRFVGGELQAVTCSGKTDSGQELTGASFQVPHQGVMFKLTIKSVRAHQSITPALRTGQGLWEYEIQWKVSGHAPQPLCATNENFALAVPHGWSSAGDLINTPDYFTFACISINTTTATTATQTRLFLGGGTIAKCIDWGYPPWATAANATEADQSTARTLHQLCVRMAMADYCGEGKSNTIDGTPIEFLNASEARAIVGTSHELEPHLPKRFHNTFALEAAWAADSCNKAQLLCMGKMRWQSLPSEGACLAIRTARNVPDCEDMTLTELEKLGARLFSYSTSIDKPLVIFSDTAEEKPTGRFLTTASVKSPEQGFRPPSGIRSYKIASEADTDLSQFTNEFSFIGAIYAPSILETLRTNQTLGLAPLYRCKKGTGTEARYLLTTTKDCEKERGYFPDGGVDKSIEGYIFLKNPFRAGDTSDGLYNSPLKLWKTASGDYITLIDKYDIPDLTLVRDLGYLPSIGQIIAPSVSMTPNKGLLPQFMDIQDFLKSKISNRPWHERL